METNVKTPLKNPANMTTIVDTPLTTMARALAASSTVLVMASETVDHQNESLREADKGIKLYMQRVSELEEELKARPSADEVGREFREKFEMLSAERDHLAEALEAERANVAGFTRDVESLRDTVTSLRGQLAKYNEKQAEP